MVAQKRAHYTMTWSKKKKKFVRGDGAGADNVKMVKTESGAKLPASYRSGRFDEWRTKARVSLPRVGEAIPETRPSNRKRFKHASVTPAKPLDKLASNYERKVRVQQKKAEAIGAVAEGKPARKGSHGLKGLTKRYGGKSLGQVRSEIKSTEQIRKARKVMASRKAKNARPSRKKRR